MDPRIFDHRPWMTSLSSMGDFVVHGPYSHSRTFLSLLGWFLNLSALLDMDDPYGQIDELISRYPVNDEMSSLVSQEVTTVTRLSIDPKC